MCVCVCVCVCVCFHIVNDKEHVRISVFCGCF